MNNNDPMVDHASASNVPGRQLLVLGPFAFIQGWFISVVLWVVPVCLTVVVQELIAAPPPESGQNYVLGIVIMVLWYGFGIGLVFAAPLAWVLGYLLRPMLHQWVHVVVFFAVPTLVFWVLGGLLEFGWTFETLGFWATVGAASAIGRFAVRKSVDLEQVSPGTSADRSAAKNASPSPHPGADSDRADPIKHPGVDENKGSHPSC